MNALAKVAPRPDGYLPDELRAGAIGRQLLEFHCTAQFHDMEQR